MTECKQHIAIFGCGQLAQMTAQAGIPLGLRFSFISEEGEDSRCVDALGQVVTLKSTMSAAELFDALGQPDVVTVEKEMVDTSLMEQLQPLTQVSPGSNAVYLAQNRIREKNFLRSLHIPTAEFEVIQSQEQLQTLPERMGYPIYIKAAESGYDGYHQWRIKKSEDLAQSALLSALENKVELIAEKHVDYTREISVIAARGCQGDIVVYPVMENRHEDGVLIATMAPAPCAETLAPAIDMIKKIVVELDYVGILTMECFDTQNGIVVNELAPRVHNSGHWTIEGAETSQFENHCRAIADMPLGSTAVNGVAGIVNMLGRHGQREQLENHKNATVFYHAYGKEERPRRKLGHVTVCAENIDQLKISLNKIMGHLYAQQYSPL